ncbi:MAG TPA: transglycosylase domain-containing protein [Streptosporangiaceae bacterium]|nr:transglycosylase domain-containing protein [Streptosporangiaceae bacterium]
MAAISLAAGVLGAAIALPVTGLVGVAARDAANTFNDLKIGTLGQVPTRSEIVDSQGNLIAYYYPNGIYRIPVSYAKISPVMRNAIVAIEDSRFYLHGAMDPRGTLRAIVNDANNTSVQGGSTLAQQYVKNALILTAPNDKARLAAIAESPERKIRELRIAANIEHQMTKNQLLAAYLNVAYFENNAYGIEVAAERYFQVHASQLTLSQSALLAGIVENPTRYDPITEPKQATARRNLVLERMAQLGKISQATAAATEKMPLGLNSSFKVLQTGCNTTSAAQEAFFCDYVVHVLRNDSAYKDVYRALNTTGGLTITTTLNPVDQAAAEHAVNFVQPSAGGTYNPQRNADSEVLVTPGSGAIRAIAVDRPYGSGPGQDTLDYAVNSTYGGGAGVQTGSSSKLFTLITALKQDVPFGFNLNVSSPATIGGYTDCHGQSTGLFQVNNDEPGKGIFTLYNGTTQSINVFYAELEQKVGLCNTVKTAVSMGVTRADGKSLLVKDGGQLPADDISSFTLGAVNVSPMSMAGAYATVAARGVYCKPVAILSITGTGGKKYPVESAGCHRVFSAAVADAANQILQGVITSGTAAGRGIGRPAAGKTGTANGGFYAAFGGYTPTLAGYVSVFNPINPTGSGAMIGPGACYRDVSGGLRCSGQMFGADAPGATWQMTFEHAALGPPVPFVGVPGNSIYFALGSGVSSPKPPKPPKKPGKPGGPGGGGPGGGGHGGPPPPVAP